MKQVGTRLEVLRGDAHHTTGGLTIKNLKVSKSSGEIVSTKRSRQGKKNDWAVSTKKAREQLIKDGVIDKDEMVLFNVGPKGKRLYELTKSLFDGK